ncbi:signal peptidase I [Aequorivita soesokkakensis]|uniref:Signal peptidase I n=1 Tax=Aequorivita soesokkakensis TaxID=1385699 RepID=A0A1A9LC95_9FLAO|nr:signal peptidase I [Aequorivita soesokkakensis]OAD90302.1 signal peptidase I [Aequorivita soesokkakensis]
MSWTGWFIFFLVVQVIHFAGTWKLYQIAGRKAWEAAVPVYNSVVLMKIINRPWWWTILLFVPIVNLIMFPVVWVETLRSFGRNSTTDTILGIVTLGLYIYYINYTQKVSYIQDRSLKPRTSTGEWVSSILFAVVAATIVHTYIMQPFTIPSSSLEKTLLVGDFLFVSKFHYGARTPMTPIAFPMVHDTIPVVGTKSYLSKPQIPYFRFPGFQEIKRNDIVVFNWPVDTLIDIRPGHMRGSLQKPIDKESNYVKRCVGLPGDSLEVRDGYVFIDGLQNDLPDRARVQHSYWVKYKNPNMRLSDEQLYLQYGITDATSEYDQETGEFKIAAVTEEAAARLKNNPNIESIRRDISPKGEMEIQRYLDENNRIVENNKVMFPNNGLVNWNNSNFGPIYIPEAGAKVAITPETISLYKRIIEVYEGSELGITNKITQSGTQVMLNGQPITEYTFKMDYYWMMGDNRDNSQDARTWGFVPFNHVVGKPVFIWMSWDSNAKGIANKIRWERLFTTVGGSGKPISYLMYFVIAVIGWFAFDFWRKRKKGAKK